MSLTQNESVDSSKRQENHAQEIANILRQDYKDSGAAIKEIQRKVDLSPHAIRNWYNGQREPSLENFIHLTKASQKLIEWFLRRVDHNVLADAINAQSILLQSDKKPLFLDIKRLIFETKSSTDMLRKMQTLKLRQLWFYAQIQKGEILRAADIMHIFEISRSTAYRDIEELLDLNLICSVGEGHARYYTALQ